MTHLNFVIASQKHYQVDRNYMVNQMTFDKKRGVIGCGHVVLKNSHKKSIQKKLAYLHYKKI